MIKSFRKRLSLTNNLSVEREEWKDALNNTKSMDAVCIDFLKTFDIMQKKTALETRKSRNCRIPLKWVKDFLIGRGQKIRTNSKCSSEKPLLNGVPQGFVLGPLLSILCANEPPSEAGSPLLLTTDCVRICREITRDVDSCALQADLCFLVKRSEKWLMSVNVTKCSYMHFG